MGCMNCGDKVNQNQDPNVIRLPDLLSKFENPNEVVISYQKVVFFRGKWIFRIKGEYINPETLETEKFEIDLLEIK